jgi:hypothetical protein
MLTLSGTPLRPAPTRGPLLAAGDWKRCTLFDLNFRPSGMSAETLAAGFRALGVDLYSASWTESRRERFNERLRQRLHLAKVAGPEHRP